MIYILITFLILSIAAVLFFLYIPTDIQPLARNAGFYIFSPRYRIMKFQKIPVRLLFEQYVKAQEVNVIMKFEDLKDYYLTYPDKVEDMVNVLIRAKRAGVRIDINDLERFEISGGNPEQLIEALKIVKNANIDISRDVLETHSLYGGNIDTFVEIILRAKKANLDLDIQGLVEENLSDDDMKKIVNILIKVKKAGLYITKKEIKELKLKDEDFDNPNADLRISQKGLLEHFRAKINIDKYADAMIKAKKAGLEIDKRVLNIHYLTDGDMEKLVSTMIKAEKAGLNISQKELVEHNIEGRDVGNIIKQIIKATQAKLDLSMDELVEFHRIGGNPEDFVKALISAKKSQLGIGKKELEEHFLAGANVLEYVKSRSLITNPDLGITKDDIDNHYLKGGDVLKTIFAIIYAKNNNVSLNPGFAFKLDLIPSVDIDEIVEWAVNPQIIEVDPPARVVSKDGIQITPRMTVTVRGKINLYLKGSREKVLFGRINEAVAEEIPKYDSYKYVLKNLNKISENVLSRLLGKMKPKINVEVNKFELEEEYKELNSKEIKLNESSAYEILDIKIFDIIIGNDTLAAHKIHHAHHEKELADIHLAERKAIAEAEAAEAKAQLLKSKAKLQEGMAEGFKTGGMKFSDYQKEKHIFGSFDDDEEDNTRHNHNNHGKEHGNHKDDEDNHNTHH